MKTRSKTTSYIIHSIAAVLLPLTAQISLAGSARWLLLPPDSAWENLSNWTPGGPPNGPSDTATFGPSSQTDVNISSSVELNSIVFASNSDSFTFIVSPYCLGCAPPGGELIFSGAGIDNQSSVLQTFVAGEAGQIIFNNTSTAGHATIGTGGATIFTDSSTADSATLVAYGGSDFGPNGGIFFNGTSSGGTARVKVFRGYPSREPNGYLYIGGHQGGV